MIAVQDVLIDDGIPGALFSCDLALCKGVCCVEGELGAPVAENEAEGILEAASQAARYLSEKNLRYIRRNGCLEVYGGEIFTRTIDGRECVFAFRNNAGLTLCAIEAGMTDKKKSVQKPMSCRLFPIRIKKKFGMDYLVYEQHAMCRQARKNGFEKQMPLVDYVSGALIERYGVDWYGRLKELLANSSKYYAGH